MGDFDEFLKEFLVESSEGLDQYDQYLIDLEQTPDDAELIASIFRCVHTIKGTCGFYGFSRLEGLTHAGENLLSKLREGELTLSHEMTSALLQLGDGVREILVRIENTGEEGDEAYADLIETLTQLQSGSPAPEAPPTSEPVEPAPQEQEESAPLDPLAEADALIAQRLAETRAEITEVPEPDPLAEADALIAQRLAERSETAEAAAELTESPANDPLQEADELIAQRLVEAAAEVARVTGTDDAGVPDESLVQPQQDDPPKEPTTATPPAAAVPAPTEETHKTSVVDSSIRVDVNLLDKLMNMVGELVLARNQILQMSATTEDRTMLETSQRLNLITTELQETVMQTRMQPIHTVWGKFPRIVRDLARELKQEVRLEMEGEDTELDRTILDAIKDPLTHIIRNAVDHGIESPEVRTAAGKPAEGVLQLRAYHEGGNVIIEIADDGAGIDLERVKAKAVSQNVITQDHAAKMSDREAATLIFHPGLSTAQKVTNISGRGVGMDVVRSNIEKIGGSIDLQTELGTGTSIKTKIPLTLAIIPAVVVTCADVRYAIPQVSLLELVRLEGEDAHTKIESIHDIAVYRLRGQLLPLVYLRDILRLPARGADVSADDEHDGAAEDATQAELIDDSVSIVVLQADDQQFGLIVDSVLDTEEIVVKPLSKQLKDVSVYAGAAIMGDGKVAIILDVMGIAETGLVLSEGNEQGHVDDGPTDGVRGTDEKLAMLLVQTSHSGPMAMPLASVARLEKIERAAVETVGKKQVVQYRNEILPLLDLGDFFRDGDGEAPPPTVTEESDTLEVVVCSRNGRNMGLVVDSVLDISEEQLQVRGDATREGVLFTAVVQEKVTEFIDVEGILGLAIGSEAEPALAVGNGDFGHG